MKPEGELLPCFGLGFGVWGFGFRAAKEKTPRGKCGPDDSCYILTMTILRKLGGHMVVSLNKGTPINIYPNIR